MVARGRWISHFNPKMGIRMAGEDFVNTKINIWLHIHGLPYELRKIEFVKTFASYAGRVKESNGSGGYKRGVV